MFKVGDWVRNNSSNTIKQYSVQDYNYDKKYNGTDMESKYWELWAPKKGEWCWFYDQGFSANILAKFVKRTNKGKYKNNMAYQSKWECCEPFIGTFPTFIKD